MANTALVGALRATLSLDTAAFESGAKKATSHADRLAKNLTRTFKAISVAALPTALGTAVKTTIDKFDELAQVSQKIGIPVEELSKLEFAAKISDVSIEALTDSVAKLSRTMATALQAPTGQAAQAFTALGISMQQLQQLTPLKALETLADSFNSLQDGTRKTALAMQLFGRSGFDLIPFLNLGSAGIRKLTDQAERLGLVVSQQTAQAADAFNDNLVVLQGTMQGVVSQIAAGMLPALVDVTNQMTQMERATGSAAKALGEQLGQVLKNNAADLRIIDMLTNRATIAVDTFNKVVNAIGTGGQLDIIAEGWAKFANEATRVNTQMDMLANSINQRGGIGSGRGAAAAAGGKASPLITIPQTAKPFWDGLSNSIRTTDQELDKLRPVSEELTARFETMGASLTDVFFDLADGTKSLKEGFHDLFESLLRDIVRLMASRAMQAFIAAFLGPAAIAPGVGPGGLGYTTFGGPRQHGGRVRRGGAYLVGERGAEMFVPRTSGQVVPNSAMGGGVSIKIVDQRSTSAPPVQSRQGSDGSTEFIIRDTIRKELPSELNRLLPSQFGAKPRLAQRGS